MTKLIAFNSYEEYIRSCIFFFLQEMKKLLKGNDKALAEASHL